MTSCTIITYTPRIENNSLKTIIFLRSRTKKEREKKKKHHHHQRCQKTNERKQRYLHLLNKGASSGNQSINKGRGKTLALVLKKFC